MLKIPRNLAKLLERLMMRSRRISRSIPTPLKRIKDYVVNGEWDTLALAEDISKQKELVHKYYASDLRKAIDEENVREAHELGFKNFLSNQNSEQKLAEEMGVHYYSDPSDNTNAYILDADKELGKRATINLNLAKIRDPKSSSFHELLHLGSLGEAEPRRVGESLEDFQKRRFSAIRYYGLKADKLFRDYAEVNHDLVNPEVYNYITWEPREAAVNLFEMGKMLGVRPGQEYPGDLIFESMLSNISLKSPDILYRSKSAMPEIIKHGTTEERQRMWKAMNGTYFALPFMIGLPTMYYMYGLDQNKQD